MLRLRMLIHSSFGPLPTVRLTKQVMMDMYRMMTWHKNTRAVHDTWVPLGISSFHNHVTVSISSVEWGPHLFICVSICNNDFLWRSPHAGISLYLTGCLLLAHIFSINVHGFPLLPSPSSPSPFSWWRGEGRESLPPPLDPPAVVVHSCCPHTTGLVC